MTTDRNVQCARARGTLMLGIHDLLASIAMRPYGTPVNAEELAKVERLIPELRNLLDTAEVMIGWNLQRIEDSA